jgi:hypothetical protein
MMLVAIALSSAAGVVVKHANSNLGWTLGGISAMSVFTLVYLLFDRVVWKWRWARKILLVPDLNGSWRCDGKTLFRHGTPLEAEWSGTVTIRQSWSRIRIVLTTGQSASQSIAASIFQEAGSGFRLIYHYDNKPGLGERELARHCGLCNLLFDENVESATGEYFTDKDRMTAGTMKLTRGGSDNAATRSA